MNLQQAVLDTLEKHSEDPGGELDRKIRQTMDEYPPCRHQSQDGCSMIDICYNISEVEEPAI